MTTLNFTKYHNLCVMRTDWVAGEGAAAGGKGYTGASGTRRALAWYLPICLQPCTSKMSAAFERHPEANTMHDHVTVAQYCLGVACQGA